MPRMFLVTQTRLKPASQKQGDPCHFTNLQKHQSFLKKKSQTEEFKWHNSEKAQKFRHQTEQIHTDSQAFPNSSAKKINFCLGYMSDELKQPLAVLPQVTAMFSQMYRSTRGRERAASLPAIFRGLGRKSTHGGTVHCNEDQGHPDDSHKVILNIW